MLIEGVLLGIIFGYFRKGRLVNLAFFKFNKLYLLFLGFLIKFGLSYSLVNYNHLFSPRYSFIITLFQYLLIFGFIFYNRKQPFIWVIGIGILLNFIVIGLNFGAMPVSNRILGLASPTIKIGLLKEGLFYTYKLIHKGTILWFLGDIICVSFPLRQFISVGDIILALGVLLLIQNIMVFSTKPRN